MILFIKYIIFKKKFVLELNFFFNIYTGMYLNVFNQKKYLEFIKILNVFFIF